MKVSCTRNLYVCHGHNNAHWPLYNLKHGNDNSTDIQKLSKMNKSSATKFNLLAAFSQNLTLPNTYKYIIISDGLFTPVGLCCTLCYYCFILLQNSTQLLTLVSYFNDFYEHVPHQSYEVVEVLKFKTCNFRIGTTSLCWQCFNNGIVSI